MKQKLMILWLGLLVGGVLFYIPPQFPSGRFLPFLHSERLIRIFPFVVQYERVMIWLICVALVACWTTLLTKNTQRGIFASILCSVMICIGYQVVVSVNRFRVGMTFDLVSWGRFIPALCVSFLMALVVGVVLSKVMLKLRT
jgi:hypothetical protein